MRVKSPLSTTLQLFIVVAPIIFLGNFLPWVSPAAGQSAATTYSPLGNVSYLVEMTMEIRNRDPSKTAVLKVYAPRYTNWSVEVPGTNPTLQASTLTNATPYGYGQAIYNQTDAFDNVYDYYSKNLAPNFGATTADRSFLLTMNYTLVAPQIRWNKDAAATLSDYDKTSDFYQLYTQDQPDFIKVSDPAIVAKASELCGTETNAVECARKIYTWVKDSLTYEVQESGGSDTGERGASWALQNLKGDCSEYSDLTVALLRAHGIPARKVAGLALLDPATSKAFSSYEKGKTWFYYKDLVTGADNITAHAWVEYYVPGIGWISCDPTWGNSGLDYFNYQDYLHIAAAKGSYFGDEVVPQMSPEIGEYPPLPLPSVAGTTNIAYTLSIRFTVLDNQLVTNTSSFDLFVALLVITGVIGLILWIAVGKKQKSVRKAKDKGKKSGKSAAAAETEWYQ